MYNTLLCKNYQQQQLTAYYVVVLSFTVLINIQQVFIITYNLSLEQLVYSNISQTSKTTLL